jgi:hypothetical protein
VILISRILDFVHHDEDSTETDPREIEFGIKWSKLPQNAKNSNKCPDSFINTTTTPTTTITTTTTAAAGTDNFEVEWVATLLSVCVREFAAINFAKNGAYTEVFHCLPQSHETSDWLVVYLCDDCFHTLSFVVHCLQTIAPLDTATGELLTASLNKS